MSDDPSPDETPVTFNIKSSSDAKYVLTIPLTTTVLALKEKLSSSEYADIPPDRQRLIYSGRVLKDPDTLSVYKIKEGNTVHLVKGAASNQRQNPANAASSSGTPQGAQGVPSNLAAGTGQDPLAALTGARYAGYAQMPNANMFGPDGGMGPPPDSEQMASMLENPAFSQQLNEALNNPAVVEQMIRSNPMFQGPMAAQARQMLQDPNFRRMMTDPATLRQMSELRRNMPGGMFGMPGMGGGGGAGGGGEGFAMPGATDGATAAGAGNGERTATPGQADNTPQPAGAPNPFAMFGAPGAGAGAGGAAQNPFAALFGPGGMGAMGGAPAGNTIAPAAGSGNADSTPGAGSGQAADANPLAAMAQNLMQNPQLMQQMMGSLNPGGGGSGGSQPPNFGANPFAALQALQGMGMGGFGGGQQQPEQRDDRAPEDRYAEQLRQLNEMGFYEFERNVEALRRTGGSVQGAVEYLLTH